MTCPVLLFDTLCWDLGLNSSWVSPLSQWLKGLCLCHRWIFWRIIIIKGTSVHALIVVTIFYFFSWWKNQTQIFSLAYFKLLTNFENPSSNRFKEPKAAILTLIILTEGRLWFCKIIPEAAFTSQFLRIFRAANERSALALENTDQSQRRDFCGGFQ
jgi:hypothetical protein